MDRNLRESAEFYGTVTPGMVVDRVARGGRAVGRSRLRNGMIVVLALVAAGAVTTRALAASGGGAVSPKSAKARHGGSSRKLPRGVANAFAGRSMWIWELSSSNHGSLGSIVAAARQYGIGTLIIKSSDGANVWSQFNPQLTSALHARGLRVCAWQYVYGIHPIAEAQLGAAAVKDGADCLLIDAESEYEGKYVQAQTYLTELRTLIGANFPVGLAGFPYIDFHPAFPYSVFLGPGGAQYNVPQMYWKDIGTTTDAVFAHTYSFNRVYGRPISPLGQVYNSPPAHQIIRFRKLSRVYGATGVSWWDWQEAAPAAWRAIAQPAGTVPDYVPYTAAASIKKGWQGDLVVWAQEHLISAGYSIPVDGGFGPKTVAAVKGFQAAHGLFTDGIVGPETWQALLRYPPAPIHWGAKASASRASIASVSGTTPLPKSASLRAKRDEIPGNGGAGRPPAR
jgi:Putative peptidoglycan binding domain